MDKVVIREQFDQMVESLVVGLGFKRQKTNGEDEYIKTTDQGFVGIVPIVIQVDKLFYLSLAFKIRIHEISEILCLINNISEEFKQGYSTLSFGIRTLSKNSNNDIKVEKKEDLETALSVFRELIEIKLLPLFERYKSTEDLDREINNENSNDKLHSGDTEQVGIIAAFLNKNPRAKYWEDYHRKKLQTKNQFTQNQYEKLVRVLATRV